MIHGGGFIMGSSSYDLISPDPHDFVKDTDVILVQVRSLEEVVMTTLIDQHLVGAISSWSVRISGAT